jgi:hypothetical protein
MIIKEKLYRINDWIIIEVNKYINNSSNMIRSHYYLFYKYDKLSIK